MSPNAASVPDGQGGPGGAGGAEGPKVLPGPQTTTYVFAPLLAVAVPCQDPPAATHTPIGDSGTLPPRPQTANSASFRKAWMIPLDSLATLAAWASAAKAIMATVVSGMIRSPGTAL